MGLLGKRFAPKGAGMPCENQLRELMENDFNVMFLPLFRLWEGEENFTVKVPYGDGSSPHFPVSLFTLHKNVPHFFRFLFKTALDICAFAV